MEIPLHFLDPWAFVFSWPGLGGRGSRGGYGGREGGAAGDDPNSARDGYNSNNDGANSPRKTNSSQPHTTIFSSQPVAAKNKFDPWAGVYNEWDVQAGINFMQFIDCLGVSS